ncbi:helix-turn-helix domain-containing protein [Streptomyces sp. NPDC052020]|uniref:helix-turn-helix domain-containing protein n=1 Tax=Streptomyces sp. NPDC052020 TaxID=3155677 RepID=UPI003427F077
MAETKPIAAARPHQGVRRTTTRSGVIHVRAYQPDRYTIVGNHLAQHRELSLTAIGLATHILSLPEGAPVDIRSLAERFPEGRDRIAFALRELEAHGYLERVREHTESGRLVTRTYAHHSPDTAATAAAPLRVAGRPPAGRRTVERQPVVRTTDVPAAPGEEDQAPPRQAPAPEPAMPTVSAPPDPRHHRAAALLAGLRRTDDRLILSRRDVDRLAPAVTAWLDNGVSAAVVHHALTDSLPVDLRNPAKLIGYRLDALLPVPVPARPTPVPRTAAGPGAARRPDPLQTCDGCERAFRAPRPGHCRDCRPRETVVGEKACAA